MSLGNQPMFERLCGARARHAGKATAVIASLFAALPTAESLPPARLPVDFTISAEPLNEPMSPPPAYFRVSAPPIRKPAAPPVVAGPQPEPAARGIAPGEDCFLAFAIPVLPFQATNDTCLATDQHDASCPGVNPGGADMVYAYTPALNDVLQISLCSPCTNYDTKLYVLDNCPGGAPVACNDDHCATLGFPEFPFVSSISDLPVIGGTTYYIVVDGYSALDCGLFELSVTGQSPGACCGPDGVCTDAVLPQSCSGLGQIHHPGRTCAEQIACGPFSPAQECGARGLFGPGLGLADGGPGFAYTSDQFSGMGYVAADGFWSLTAPLTTVTWWGVFLNWNGAQFTGPCMPGSTKDQFEVTIRSDAGGLPGPIAFGPIIATAVIEDTGSPFALGATIQRCTVVLPAPVQLAQGWVSVQALDAPAQPNCVHLWVNNPAPDAGDGFAAQQPMAGAPSRVDGDLALCLGGAGCPTWPGDQNGDGCTDGVDIQHVVNCVLAGDLIVPGCECADLNADLLADVDDSILMAEAMLNPPFGIREIPLLSVEILTDAIPDESSGSDFGGAARAYHGVPVSLRLTSPSMPVLLTGLTLVVKDQDEALLHTEPLAFTAGMSQTIMLPASTLDRHEFLYVAGPAVPTNYLIYRILVGAGPAALAEASDLSTSGQIIGDPINTPPASLTFVGEPAHCGSAQILNITSPMNAPDDPFSGPVGSLDYYVVRLRDALGRPCAGQLIAVSANNTAVLGLHEPGKGGLAPMSAVQVQSDDHGFVRVLVRYVGAGASGLTLQSQVSGAAALAAPQPGGGAAVFIASATTDTVIGEVTAEKIKDTETKVNGGVKDGGGILVYGTTYCFKATTTKRLKPKEKIVWCVNDMPLNDAQNARVEGAEAYVTVADPHANTADRSQVKITAKIAVVNGNGSETVTPVETICFPVVEKKTIPLCVFQFKKLNPPSAMDWAAEVKRLNEIYNGTGVCFSLMETAIMNKIGGEKVLGVGTVGEGAMAKVDVNGSLVTCVCNDPMLEGKKNKITLYVGVNGQVKGGDGWTKINGYAIGANEALEAEKLMAKYDICGKFANTAAVKGDTVNGKRATICHEIGHLLGCIHSNSDMGNLMHEMHDDKGHKLTPEQAEIIYKTACKIMMSKC